ncbi:MAG TPA: hypothetical protein PLV61_03505 [Parvularculaceae bacterium]|nr:hypothetical protein [Amphiplicatus sp.]MCB9955409.1 hypothetical protein [Caulobacterales bacterium]HOP20219.1 hypothetical protein [Amphiplicatus sp.]HPE30233.1 hypothetical protein [Parvularculaceae bacterium]HRX38055.1 hypothetical protein [Parvularculaceae bacterium]
MSDDAIVRNILKFVRQIDGGETDESVLKSAIARRWIDTRGFPTADGRKLVSSFDDLNRFALPRA